MAPKEDKNKEIVDNLITTFADITEHSKKVFIGNYNDSYFVEIQNIGNTSKGIKLYKIQIYVVGQDIIINNILEFNDINEAILRAMELINMNMIKHGKIVIT